MVSAGESNGGMEQLGHYVEEQCNEELFNEDPLFSDLNNADAGQHEAEVMSNSGFALGPSDALDAEGDGVAVEAPVDDLEALVTSQYKVTLGQQRKRGRATGVMKRKKQATLERRKVAPVSRAARHRADLVARFGEDRVASDGELKGLTRQLVGGSIEWLEPNTGKWLPAAPHEIFRAEFIRKDEAKYSPYNIPPEKGKMKLDVTSNCDIGLQNSWTFDKDGFAKIVDGIGNPVGFINKPPEDTPRYPDSDYLYHNGLIMLDPDDRPVLDWRDIPLCFSSKLEGGRMEALRRVFPWLRLPDFRARMPRCASNEQGQAIPLGGISTLGQRMARFRESIGCGPWIERNGPAAKKRKLAKKIDLVEIDEEANIHDQKQSSGPVAVPNASTATWHPMTHNPLQAPLQTPQLFLTNSTRQTYPNAPYYMPTNMYPPPTSYPSPTPYPTYANVPSHTNRTDFSYINPQTESEMQEVRNALRLTRADFSAYHCCAAPTLPEGTSYFEQYKFLQNTHTVMWTVPDAPAPQLLGVESWHDSFENWVPPKLNQWQLKNLLSSCIFPSL